MMELPKQQTEEKMLNKTAMFLIASVTLGLAGTAKAEVAKSCVVPTDDEVAGLFDRWNSSLATGEPAQVAANYLDNAVLLPTVSNEMRTDTSSIEAYFVDFLAKKPVGEINQRVITTSCNQASDVGIYTFSFDDGQQVQARYSYIYDYVDGQWLIRHHHSSAMPE